MNPTGGTWWPTSCRVCHRWQRAVLCTGCLDDAGLHAPRCSRCALRLPAGKACTAIADDDDGLCQGCREDPPVFDHASTALDYAEPWAGLIASLKFQQDTAMANVLARLMTPSLQRRWQLATTSKASPRNMRPARRAHWKPGAPSAIIPVPLAASRLRERGYNQAGLLARHLSRYLGLPLWPDALSRHRDTPRLMTLDADERLRHIRKAFAVSPRHEPWLQGRHVAVVDDVLTTGATLDEIARTLWLAGAREVSVWVAARTPAQGRTGDAREGMPD